MATLKDTALHFGVSVQAISDYVKKHLDEINVDGAHAVMHKGKMAFRRHCHCTIGRNARI